MKLFFRKIHSFWQLPRQQKTLILVSFFLSGIARASIKIFSLQKLAPFFGHRCQGIVCSTLLSPAQISQAILIRRAIKTAVQYTPWISNCLPQAMVARWLCRYYGIPYMFYIGFAPTKTESNKLNGHAWVTAGPIAITGGHSFRSHAVLLSYTSSIGIDLAESTPG